MEPRKVFRAPWSRSLRWTTGLSVAFLLALALLGLTLGPRDLLVWRLGMVVMPLGILLGSALFVIRGYEITPGKLLVRRLLWSTTVDLAGLLTVSLGAHLMRGSVRVFGNGGLFSFTGRFRNSLLGLYRAFATHPDRAVALRFADRVVVITPDDPQEAAWELEAFALQPAWRGVEHPSDWIPFDHGTSIGQYGSEGGVIAGDEEHVEGARITLEQDAGSAPWTITCGIYGWMVHTRFFSTESEARGEYEKMKEELARIMTLIPLQADPEAEAKFPAVGKALSDFVDRFP